MKISSSENIDVYFDLDDYPKLNVLIDKSKNCNQIRLFKNDFGPGAVNLRLNNGQMQQLKALLCSKPRITLKLEERDE